MINISYLAAGIQFYKNKNYLEYLKELKKILETEIFREYTSHRTRKPNPVEDSIEMINRI